MNADSSDVTQDLRWASVVARDKTADGSFWYSVATTGIYCRPSCPSRLANPKNVQLHDSIDAAEAAGFRACRRCNPGGMSIEAANTAIVTKACRRMDEASEPVSLAQLAEAVELSPQYFHRLKKNHRADAQGLCDSWAVDPPARRAGHGGDRDAGVS